MRALVVEDDPHMRELVARVVAKRGHDVTALGDAETALKSHAADPFPLIILDLTLPGMDGLELCRQIRTMRGGDDVIILVITGRVEPQDLAAVLDAGASDYLAKPVGTRMLRTRIASPNGASPS